MLSTAQVTKSSADLSKSAGIRPHEAASVPKPRYVEIDVLKAVCVLGVVLQHCLRVGWDPRITATEIWLWKMTRFAVPGFLLASGFLYAAAYPIPAGVTTARLRRILTPYLVASLAAELWKVTHGTSIAASTVLRDLLTGSAIGIYYYVFVLFWFVVFTPLFARIPRSCFPPLIVAGVLIPFLQPFGWIPLDAMWSWRNPLIWWGYFLIGWWIRVNEERFRRWVIPRRVLVSVASGAAVVLCATIMGAAESHHFGLPMIGAYAILAFVVVASCGRGRSWRPVQLLSEASYPVYLFHVFFIFAAAPIIGADTGLGEILAVLCTAGLVGPLVLILLVRKIFGRYARDLVGF